MAKESSEFGKEGLRVFACKYNRSERFNTLAFSISQEPVKFGSGGQVKYRDALDSFASKDCGRDRGRSRDRHHYRD